MIGARKSALSIFTQTPSTHAQPEDCTGVKDDFPPSRILPYFRFVGEKVAFDLNLFREPKDGLYLALLAYWDDACYRLPIPNNSKRRHAFFNLREDVLKFSTYHCVFHYCWHNVPPLEYYSIFYDIVFDDP